MEFVDFLAWASLHVAQVPPSANPVSEDLELEGLSVMLSLTMQSQAIAGDVCLVGAPEGCRARVGRVCYDEMR